MSRNWTDEESWGMVVKKSVSGRRNRECKNRPMSQSKEVVSKWEKLLRLEHRIKVGSNESGEVGRGPHIASGI